MVVSLVACGESPAQQGGSTKAGDNPAQTTSKGQQEQPAATGMFDKVSIPENVHLVMTLSGVTKGSHLYKIGNKMMGVEGSSVVYGEYNPTTKMVTFRFGEIINDAVEWDDSTDATDPYDFMGWVGVKEVFEYADSSSFLRKYCKKTDDKQDILGHNTVKYYDEDTKYEYWMEESTMMCFQQVIIGFVYEIITYETSGIEFPYAAP